MRALIRAGFGCAIVLIVPAVGSGQERAAVAQCSFDTAAVTSLHTFTIGLAAAGADLVPVDGPPEALGAAEAIASHFAAPGSMSLPLWARVGVMGSSASSPVPAVGHGFDDFIHLTLSRDGRLGDRNLDIRTASAEFNEALAQAVLRADSASALPVPSEFLERTRNRVTLRLVDVDKVNVPSFPLMRMVIPTIRAESGVRVIRLPGAEYPRNAAYAAVEDSVEVQYVVSEAGVADVNAPFALLRVRYRPFAEAVIEAVRKGTFEPARVRGCPIPMLVRQAFFFAIRR
ncbi:MAG TPA: hypothetical protein VF981_00900 [Gemmatimonadaceae bacterium]